MGKYITMGLLINLYACGMVTNQPPATYNDSIPIIENNHAKDTSLNSNVEISQLIVPGKSIGRIVLGEDEKKAIAQFGNADFSDAAMGSSLMIWYTNHDSTGYQTSIFSNHYFGNKDENIAHIKKILVTSPWFKTSEHVSIGSTIGYISNYFAIKSMAYNQDKNLQVYTDTTKGISFEMNKSSGKCVGIIVQEPGQEGATYINMHQK